MAVSGSPSTTRSSAGSLYWASWPAANRRNSSSETPAGPAHADLGVLGWIGHSRADADARFSAGVADHQRGPEALAGLTDQGRGGRAPADDDGLHTRQVVAVEAGDLQHEGHLGGDPPHGGHAVLAGQGQRLLGPPPAGA